MASGTNNQSNRERINYIYLVSSYKKFLGEFNCMGV